MVDFIYNTSSWQDFSTLCTEFADDVIKTSALNFKIRNPSSRCAHHPSARPVNSNCSHLHFNPIDARRIQTLYRISKKRAARKVFEDSSPTYTGSVDDANSFFSKVFDNKDCNIENILDRLQEFVPKGPTDDGLLLPPSSEEISKKFCSLSNSSPGANKVEYRHLKSVDPKCNILALIFARCMTQCDVPESWKTSTTILIHKKGSSDDVSNFRPIALMSCIYKLLMSVIANRLVSFSINKTSSLHLKKVPGHLKVVTNTPLFYNHWFQMPNVIRRTCSLLGLIFEMRSVVFLMT